MPKKNPIAKAIKEAKFIKALVDSSGNAKEAYTAIRPHVTGHSAEVSGSQALSKLEKQDIDALYEKIGCTKYAVLSGLWEKMKLDKVGFGEGTRILSKIAGWDKNSGGLAELLNRDLDLIEVVKIRLRKLPKDNNLSKPIDIDVTSTSSSSDEKQDSDEGQG